MKQDTKEKLGMVALVGVGLYVLTRDSDKGYAGGFGGGGGIPLLPGDTEGAAEGDTIINYILPKPEKEDIDWGIDPEPVSKKLTYAPSLMPTYPLEYYTSGGVSELSEFASPAQKLKSVMELQHYQDPFAYAFSGRRDAPGDVSGMVDTKKDEVKAQTLKSDEGGAAWYNPFAWNWAEAAENYQDWSTRSTERTLGIDTGKKTTTAEKAKSYQEWASASTARTLSAPSRTGGKEWTRGSESLSARKTSFGGKSIYSTQAGSTRETPFSKKRAASRAGQPD